MSPPRLASVHARVRSPPRYPQLLLATCLVGMYSTTFTATVFSVAVKVVADDLDSTPQVVAWVVTAPLLAQAVAMPVLRRLGDIRGHRRVYLTGFSLAVVLCLATSAAWNGLDAGSAL